MVDVYWGPASDSMRNKLLQLKILMQDEPAVVGGRFICPTLTSSSCFPTTLMRIWMSPILGMGPYRVSWFVMLRMVQVLTLIPPLPALFVFPPLPCDRL